MSDSNDRRATAGTATDTDSERHHDLLGEIDAAQREIESVISVVDAGRPVDMIRYVASRARLDAAIASWNLRADTDRPAVR